MNDSLVRALDSLRTGRFLLVYDADGREGETDLLVASEKVTPEAVRAMRREAGGLICTTFEARLDAHLHLPFFDEVLAAARERFPTLRGVADDDLRYDARSSFSLWVNHRETFTGITDRDRALTITRFAAFAARALATGDGWAREAFGKEFRSPGHVPLIKAAPGLLRDRRGHTELATALVAMAGMTPSATICEMMGDDGRALSKAEAKGYAAARNLAFLEGSEILEAWRAWSA
jgi:3,4-dihydroxy 2-butanone 4-phosphate synthase